jgi:protein TonB
MVALLSMTGLLIWLKKHRARSNARLKDRRTARILYLATFVCALHAGLLALLVGQPSTRSEPPPVRVVAVEWLRATPAAVSVPPAVRLPARALPHPAAAAPTRRTVTPERPVQIESAKPEVPSVEHPAAVATAAATPPAAAAPSSAAASATTAPTLATPAVPKSVAHLDCTVARPNYPSLSRRRGEAGTVVIELSTDTSGRVASARVITTSGYPRLDDAARDAALASRCAPYMENGTALRARATVPMNFNLSD